MTKEQFDQAAVDVDECLKSFLQYCSEASERSAVNNAMHYVKETYDPSQDEYTKLKKVAQRLFYDIQRRSEKE